MNAATPWNPYCGTAPVPGELLARWNFDPLLLALVVLGTIAIAAHGGPARRGRLVAALLLVLFLFVSPFCALSSALFSARVAHHALLGSVIAPLLVASLPQPQKDRAPTLRSALPVTLASATAIQAVLLWLWHAPPIYAWALSSHFAYWLMQASLLGSAWIFWSRIRFASPPAAVGALLVTMVQMGLLGALITFSGVPLYAPHLLTTAAWGFSPLEDQQLAGLIMWAPAAGIYLMAALVLANRWLESRARISAR